LSPVCAVSRKSVPYTVREQLESEGDGVVGKILRTDYLEEPPVVREIVAVYIFIVR